MVKGANDPGRFPFQCWKFATWIAVSIHHVGGDDISSQLRDVGDIGILDTVIIPMVHFFRAWGDGLAHILEGLIDILGSPGHHIVRTALGFAIAKDVISSMDLLNGGISHAIFVPAIGVGMDRLGVDQFPVPQSGGGTEVSQAGAIRPVGKVPMLTKHVEHTVFIIDADVIALLTWKSAGGFPFATGFFERAREGLNNTFFVEVVGPINFHPVIVLVVFTDDVLVGNEFPICAAPGEFFRTPEMSSLRRVDDD